MTEEEGVIWHNTTATAPKPGYLSVRLITRIGRKPIADLPVRFYKSDARGKQGDEVTSDAIKSDKLGWAYLDKIVDAGCYLCVVEDETSEVMMPVEKKEDPEDVLLPRGFLAVKVHYYGELMGDLDVDFFEPDENGDKSDTLVGKVKTDYQGLAAYWNEVKIGNYYCVVEDQEAASISTVEDTQSPYELSLPVGRSQLDVLDEEDLPPQKPLTDQPPPFAGYLSVRVLYEGEPYNGAIVRIYSATEDGTKGALLADLVADEAGLADSGMMYLPGNYLCEVDQEGEFSLSTVESRDKPYLVELPPGRSRVAEVIEPPAGPVLTVPDGAAPMVGYLSVRVLNHGEPVTELSVKFRALGPDGEPVGAPMVAETDPDGVATLAEKFVVGNYGVEIDGASATVSTVEKPDAPYALNLPLGRGMVAEEIEPPATPPVPVGDMTPAAGGYLAVLVLSEGEPYPEVPVSFYAAAADGSRGGLISQVQTGVDGVATVDGMFAFGNYYCVVEGEDISLTTVEVLSKPYRVSLPVGRAAVSEPEEEPEQSPPSPLSDTPAAETEYLSVRVESGAGPGAGAKVRFFANLKGDKQGPLVGEAVAGKDGVATLDGAIQEGRYWCSVDGAPGTLVETTVSTGRPVSVKAGG